MKSINLTSKGLVVEINETYKSPADLDRLIEVLSEYHEHFMEHVRRCEQEACDDQEFLEST